MTEQERIRNRILKSGKLPTSPTAAPPAAAGAFTPTAMFKNTPSTPAPSYASAYAEAITSGGAPENKTPYTKVMFETFGDDLLHGIDSAVKLGKGWKPVEEVERVETEVENLLPRTKSYVEYYNTLNPGNKFYTVPKSANYTDRIIKGDSEKIDEHFEKSPSNLSAYMHGLSNYVKDTKKNYAQYKNKEAYDRVNNEATKLSNMSSDELKLERIRSKSDVTLLERFNELEEYKAYIDNAVTSEDKRIAQEHMNAFLDVYGYSDYDSAYKDLYERTKHIPIGKTNKVAYMLPDGQTIMWDDLISDAEHNEYTKEYFTKVSANPDFTEKSTYHKKSVKYESTIIIGEGEYYEPSTKEDQRTHYYNLVNNDPTAVDSCEKTYLTSRGKEDYRYRMYLSEDEKKVFNYLYETQGYESAREYVENMKKILERRRLQDDIKSYTEFAEENPVTASVISTLSSPITNLSGFVGGITGADKTSGLYAGTHFTNTVRSTVENNINSGLGKFLYRHGMDVADQVVALAMGGFGRYGKLSKAATQTIMSTGAFSQTVLNSKERGLSDEEAIFLGTIAGASEYFFESKGFDALFDKDGLMKESAWKYWLNSLKTEEIGEFGTELTNDVFDVLVSQDASEWKREIDSYIVSGMTQKEAFSKAIGNAASRYGDIALGTLFSTGVMSGTPAVTSSVKQAYTDSKTGSWLRSDNADADGEITRSVIEEGLDFEDDSDAMYSEPSEEFDGRSFEELMGLDGTEKSTSTSKVPEIKLPTAEDILSGNYTPATPVTTPVKEIKLKTGEEIVAEERAKEEALSSTKKFEDLSKIGKKQIADTSYDSSGMINTQPIKEDKGLWKKIKDGANYLASKLIDSGRGVTKIAKETGDGKLYGYYNMARASQNIAAYMVMNAATDINGRATGKSLTAIFEPIHQKGKDYYRKFQEYLYHKHNIDRMSLKSNNEDIATANNAFVDFQKSHPELNAYTPSQISEIAYTPGHELHDEAKEYMKLARLSDEVRRRENKPVFGPDASGKVPDAKESRIISDNLLAEHPEFAEYAKEVYSYLDNLMDYREASGLITPEQRAVLKKLYPNYVPTFRVTKKGEGRRNKNKVEIGSTIGKAEGGTTTLMPIEQALIQLTGQVVSEGTKNRFGSRLLNDVMKYSGKDYEKSPVAKYVVEEPAKADYFNGAEYYDDTVQGGKNDKATTNTFIVYKDGKRWQMKTNGLLYEAVSALDRNATEELNLMAKTNDVFKKLITEYNPAFLIRNGIKDIQEALFNSKDLSKFSQNYPIAIKEIATNGEYWQVYQALGGLNASLYDSPGLSSGASSDVANGVKKIVDVYTFANVNRIIEQLPRFAEFVATVKKNGGIENASMDVLTEAMYNAAEVTTNFGRSGQWTKVLNKYAVPFLNPAVQGASKAIRNITSATSFAAWARLIAKGVIFGFTPELLNYLFYSDDEDYESISDENKANYYLFKYDDGKFIKIPKGRYISAINYTFREIIDAIKGEKFDVVDTAKHVTDQIGVANPLTNNFFYPLIATAVTDDENPGETWYGSDIEGESLQNLPVTERYDARTDEFSKFIGKTFNLSPKKINYLLNQYGGVLADVFLPMLTPAAENDFISANFTLDSTATNKYSGEYYDAKKKADYSANSIKATPYDTLSQKYWTDRTKGISEVNKVIREIEADESISDKDKKELLHVQYGIRNALYKTALDTSKKFDKVSREYYDKAPYKNNEDKLSYAFAMATRDVFGAEYALSSVNKTAYKEAAELSGSGISYDEYFDAYFAYDKIKADNKNSKVRRTEFAHWLNKNGKDMNSAERAALREALIGEGETSYDKLVSAGVSDKGAYEVGVKLDKLDPDPYTAYKTVQPYQKYRVIINSSLSDRDTVAAMKAISTDAQAQKIQKLADSGIDLNLFTRLAENIGKAGKSVWSVSNSELRVWIDRLTPPALGLDAPLTWPQIKNTLYSALTSKAASTPKNSSTTSTNTATAGKFLIQQMK